MLLNLGCGSKTVGDPDVHNLDWSVLLRLRSSQLFRPFSRLVLAGERRDRFAALPENIVVANIAKGLPYSNSSVDAVYHSHLLEHLDPPDAKALFAEALRVLRPGGIHRTVVPDFEQLCRLYLASVDACDRDATLVREHDSSIAVIIEQMVRKIPDGTSRQPRWRQLIEMALLGDARRRGETHQWMYDRHTMTELYRESGFHNVTIRQFNESTIARWAELGLELNEDGREYKPGSLYVEANK
jgi:ubiquinone/menaquinone biosynthesis C-methylase UbiE